MRITAMEEYGLRCLLRVARQPAGEPISAQDVADREKLSLPYVQKLLRVLMAGDLLVSYRGAAGGYVLARSAAEISLGDAIRALDGMIEVESICERHTGEQEVCAHVGECSLRPVWSCVTEFIIHTFDAIPLILLTREEAIVAGLLRQLAPAPLVLDRALVDPPVEVAPSS